MSALHEAVRHVPHFHHYAYPIVAAIFAVSGWITKYHKIIERVYGAFTRLLGSVKRAPVSKHDKVLLVILALAKQVRDMTPEQRAYIKGGVEYLMREITMAPGVPTPAVANAMTEVHAEVVRELQAGTAPLSAVAGKDDHHFFT